MNVRTIIFASLGAMLVLVAALLLIGGGDEEAADIPPARPIPVDRPVRDDSVTPDSLELADTLAGDTVAAPAAERPATGSPGDATDGADPRSGPEANGAVPGDAATGSAPQSQETVEEVLRATARRYESVRALQAEFEQHLTNTLLGRTTRSTGMLYQRQPDRFLMRFEEPAGDIIVSDGRYFWLYYPSSDPRQVIRSERGAGGLDLRSQFVGDPVSRFEATSQGTEMVRGRRTHVITLVPREPVGYRRLQVWIDAEDHLVRRFELTEDNGNVRRFELTDLRINPSLPDDLFRFEPPPGAVVVTR